MIGNLPDLLYNIGSKSLDPDFLVGKKYMETCRNS